MLFINAVHKAVHNEQLSVDVIKDFNQNSNNNNTLQKSHLNLGKTQKF